MGNKMLSLDYVVFDNIVDHVIEDSFEYFRQLNLAVTNTQDKLESDISVFISKGNNSEDIPDWFDKDIYYANRFEKITYNMALVYLFSQIECLIKYACHLIGINTKYFTKNRIEHDKNSNILITELLKQCNMNQNKKINEIRLINNSIKHNNGLPSNELCKLNKDKWINSDGEKEYIKLTYDELTDYLTACRAFFTDLEKNIRTEFFEDQSK